MLPFILAGVALYAVTRSSKKDTPVSKCVSSEQDVLFYREYARQANSQMQAREKELEWRRVKEKQVKTKRYIANLRAKQSRCKKGSHKYLELQHKINTAIRKRENYQGEANRLKSRRE